MTIQVIVEYHARFREIAGVGEETFVLEEPSMAELAERIATKHGEHMRALLIDQVNQTLNTNGTMYMNAEGQRVFIEDKLANGERITFLVGIAGG